MASHHAYDLESVATDSVASSPRSDHFTSHDLHARLRFMCSFGGKILPRPSDNQLRYVGGDTRIVAIQRSTTFSGLLNKLSKLAGTMNISIKYQLPNEDLDSLISVTTDEDVENMMEEYDRLAQTMSNSKAARLRLFLFTKVGDESQASSISSLLEGSAKREHWFVDALNSGGLDRGRSEASSIVSEVPDYLFGLDNSDEGPVREPKPKSRLAQPDNVSASDPGSPAPVVSPPPVSLNSSTSVTATVVSMPELRPVKTKPDNPDPIVESKGNGNENSAKKGEIMPIMSQPQPTGYPGSPAWHYSPDTYHSGHPMQQVQVYYVPGPVQHGNYQVQPVPIRPSPQYVVQQQYPTVHSGHMPVAYTNPDPMSGQVRNGGGVRPPVLGMGPYDGVSQELYYGARNTGMVHGYAGMVAPPGEGVQSLGGDAKAGQVSQI